jgi:hypothetical protein
MNPSAFPDPAAAAAVIFVAALLVASALPFVFDGWRDLRDIEQTRPAREARLLASAFALAPASVLLGRKTSFVVGDSPLGSPTAPTANGGRSAGDSGGKPVDGALTLGSAPAPVAVNRLSTRLVHTVPKASSTVPAAPGASL